MSDVDTDRTDPQPDTADEAVAVERPVVATASSRWRRLFLGQTAIDFWGRRRRWYGLSAALVVVTVASLLTSGLQLGIDFEGGIAWDVPAANGFTVDDARDVLGDNGVEANSAKIQERSSDSGDIIKVQVEDQPGDVRAAVQADLAEAAGVGIDEVSVSSVSSTWGWEITKQAITALVVFLTLIAIYISLRFEWRMAVASLVAMVHDLVISVGIYSVFGFEVTPATVIAFLTILGYSLYDSVVVFDKMRENERRLASAGLSAADLVNVSTNQVLLRSLNTTVASGLPVLALLLIGAGLLGQVTLREFAIALLVGMITGAYSSLFIATPMLGWLKASEPQFARRHPGHHLVGDDLRAVVVGGAAAVRAPGARQRTAKRSGRTAAGAAKGTEAAAVPTVTPEVQPATAETLLSHPPRPRKKRRN